MKNYWLKWRRTLFIVTLLAATALLTQHFKKHQLPKIKNWLLVEIEAKSKKHLPIRVLSENAEFHLLPVGITFYNTKILPQKGLESMLRPLSVRKIRVRLSTWDFFKGQIRIGDILISEAEVQFIVKNIANKTEYKFDYKLLNQIPLDRIRLKNIKLAAKVEASNLLTQIDNFNIEIENRFNTLKVSLNAKSLKIKEGGSKSIFESDLSTQFLIDSGGLYFTNIYLKRDSSFLTGNGTITGDIINGEAKEVRAKIRGDIDFEDAAKLIREFYKNTALPAVIGRVNFDTDLEYLIGKNSFRASYLLNTAGFKINQFKIGEIFATGKADENLISIIRASAKSNYGELSLENSSVALKNRLSFQAKIKAHKLKLNAFLMSLGLPETPVDAELSGDLPCLGQLQTNIRIECKGAIRGSDFAVIVDKEKPFMITGFKNFGVVGQVAINNSQVSYKTKLNIGDSSGESDGVISYANGFNINYATQSLKLSNIIDIANLQPEGELQISGNTKGNSSSATIDLNAKGEKLWLSGFYLGRANFDLKYLKGNLQINNIDGQTGGSRYRANTKINLLKSTIDLRANLPFIEVNDLLQTLSRKFVLPIEATGTGSANIHLHGPLVLNQLSYDLNSSLFRGTLAGEAYDKIQFNVTSERGRAEIKEASLYKSKSSIKASGNMNPTGMIDIKLVGQNFQIEQSENLAQMKVNLAGILNFDMNLNKHIFHPNIELNGSVTNTVVDDVAAKNSAFQLISNEQEVRFKGAFLGDAIDFSVRHPRLASGTTSIKSSINKWNFAQSFSMFTETLKNINYTTSATAKIDLQIPNNNFAAPSGEMTIDELHLQSGQIKMSTQRPAKISFDNGRVSTNAFEIMGDNTFIRLNSNPTQSSKLDLTLDGRFDLVLASLFTPFLDDIRGLTRFSFRVTGDLKKPQINGSSYIEDGVIKFKGFPHALDHVTGDALINTDKIIINAVKGRIASGPFSGSGKIEFKGLTQIPIDIRGQFSDAKFNVPPGFTTRGSGDFFLRGEWFPYTVGVNYTIDSGTIERTEKNTAATSRDVKPSAYLPKFLSLQRFSPITLALDVNMRKPVQVRIGIAPVDIRTNVYGQMKINGPPESPLLTGRVNITRGSKITLNNNTFEISAGFVEYNNTPPENPAINVTAQAKISATMNSGEIRKYDVDMRAQGTVLNPKVTFTSDPPLPENDLVSLITLGFINEAQVEESILSEGDQQTNTYYQIGSAIISGQLGLSKIFEKQLGVQFDFNSSFDASDKAEKHKFTLRKQWSPKFGTTASREIGKTSTNNVKAEYKLNKSISVIGEWEGKQTTGALPSAQSTDEKNIFGVDIEYKVEFK